MAAPIWGRWPPWCLPKSWGRSSFGGFTSSTLVHSDMSAVHIALRGTPEQKRKISAGDHSRRDHLLDRRDRAGCRFRRCRVEDPARRDGDFWVINGSQDVITNAVYGDILIVAARTDPRAKGSRGISLFIVERNTPGISATKLDKHGWLCSDTAELGFQDVRIPAENLLGEENKGCYGIMETFQNERICIGGICAGESARAIELTHELREDAGRRSAARCGTSRRCGSSWRSSRPRPRLPGSSPTMPPSWPRRATLPARSPRW